MFILIIYSTFHILVAVVGASKRKDFIVLPLTSIKPEHTVD
jgi:hypothetical protein